VNDRIEIHELRTNRALTVLVALQPIRTRRVNTGTCRWTCSGHFSSVHVVLTRGGSRK